MDGALAIGVGKLGRQRHRCRRLARIVAWLYEAGLGNDNGSGRLWADAEQFLERLEIATRETPSQLTKDIRDRIGSSARGKPKDGFIPRAVQCFQMEQDHAGKPGLERLYPEAVRFVAGACSQFLWRAEQTTTIVDESEQWDPYRRWVGLLRPGYDTVITFNYDRVLDILAGYCRRQLSRSSLISPVGMTANKFSTLSKTSVPMFHLHGHVGWLLSDDRKSIVVSASSSGFSENPAVAHKTPDKAVIGLPGQHKLSLPAGLLKDTWDGAMAAISDADAVVFCGYRFPETDNMAKRCLFDALRAKPTSKVHIVLGTGNPDRPRLEGLIAWTRMGHGNPARVHELWAQDFFAVFERNGL
jgi:hypothetical protein